MTNERRPRATIRSLRPGSVMSQKMQPVGSPLALVTYASLQGAHKRSTAGAGVSGLGASGEGGTPAANPQPLAPTHHYTARASGGIVPVAGEPTEGAGSLLISSLSSLPGLKYGTFFGGTSTLSPVFGLRPFRGSRLRSRKLPNPRSSIFSPRCSASMMLRNTVSTITSECFFVRSDTRETSSTSSALVMLPFVISAPSMADG